ncbi:hypothetical protein WDA79_02320 [Streptomyces sp. A475]|uniref:hypothetical protein n=1 Tax=Streptomyces sp. A475 TaxID=3131976 RepID=UPI0030C9B0B1
MWADLVDAWATQDANLMDEIWDDIITDLDSDYAAYAYVSSVGISARSESRAVARGDGWHLPALR